jgi:hypothetical protein
VKGQWVALGWVRYVPLGQVTDAQAQRIMRNFISPHDFKKMSNLYQKVQEVETREYGVITDDEKSQPNFIYVRPGISPVTKSAPVVTAWILGWLGAD